MKEFLPKNLLKLADVCQDSLYIVGGAVRDFLSGYALGAGTDWDLCSPMRVEALTERAESLGFSVKAVYKHTGTVKLEDPEGIGYEFSRFRFDRYERGEHVPREIVFTEDIARDAVRRDFRANAVYYDIRRGEIVDPLNGVEDVKTRTLRTVAPAEKVFGEDGLRLMRLARISAQTGFTPDAECLAGAARHCALIEDIAIERIFSELVLLLHADGKGRNPDGPYQGLKLLKEIGVLERILPELTLGEGMTQRPDFHDHDVLEHSLRCVRYSDSSIRFAALLHDVGKPFCKLRDGDYHAHPEEGERLTREIMGRWKASAKLREETCRLVRLHMRDYNLEMKESKLRRELVEDYDILPKLLLLKQADFSACKDKLIPAPCVLKWEALLKKMREEGVPFTLKELALKGDDLLRASVPAAEVKEALKELLFYCAEDGSRNTEEKLRKHIGNLYG